MPRIVNIAAAQYPLTEVASVAAYEQKIAQWVEAAVAKGAELLVFPEYGAMELAAIGNRGHDLLTARTAVAERIADIDRIHAALARKHCVTIVAGSFPEYRGDLVLNVAHIFGPTGMMGSHDKIMPTPWERSQWQMTGGRTLTVFDIGGVKIGLVICYDIEFPLHGRALAEAGAEIILAPSDTETDWGYWRVRTGAVARALENQVYTVHAPLVGPAPFCLPCAANVGAAAVFAPSDRGFPPGGVVAIGEMNAPQWVHARLDLDLLAEVRANGGVQTYKHWPEQPGAGPLPVARIVNLAG